jgi:hypothetical protein
VSDKAAVGKVCLRAVGLVAADSRSASAVHSVYYQGVVKQGAVPYRSRDVKYVLVVKCRILF